MKMVHLNIYFLLNIKNIFIITNNFIPFIASYSIRLFNSCFNESKYDLFFLKQRSHSCVGMRSFTGGISADVAYMLLFRDNIK